MSHVTWNIWLVFVCPTSSTVPFVQEMGGKNPPFSSSSNKPYQSVQIEQWLQSSPHSAKGLAVSPVLMRVEGAECTDQVRFGRCHRLRDDDGLSF